jgi:TRAP-type C4-dicarboxylate transport system permease small subunit
MNENRQEFEVLDDISDIKWIDGPVFIVFWTLLIIVFIQFFSRYVLNSSLSWTEEIARYLLILLGFVGSVTCIRKRSHIYLEFFYRFLRPTVVKWIVIIVSFINAAFFTYAGVLSIELARRTHHQSMTSIDLPKGIIYWIVAVSCFAMALVALWEFISLFRKRSEDVTHELEETIVRSQ